MFEARLDSPSIAAHAACVPDCRRSWAAVIPVAGFLLLWCLPAAPAVLSPETRRIYDHYVRLTEARMEKDLERGVYLWIDGDPARRDERYRRLRLGEVLIEKLVTEENGRPVAAPGAIIHHYVAVVFLPGASLERVLSLVHDYGNYHRYYAPDIVAARLLEERPGGATIALRIYQKKGLSATVDTEQTVEYRRLDPLRHMSRARTTKVHEVGRDGEDRGFLWATNSYRRYWEKDGGTYMQIEGVSLSRDAPLALGWLVNRFIRSAHKDFLLHLMEATRRALAAN